MLADLEAKARSLFAEAAERQRAHAVWVASGHDDGMPMGASVLAIYATEAVASWREEARNQEVLTEAPEDPEPVEGEPEGLSPDLLLLYRQFVAQVTEAEGA